MTTRWPRPASSVETRSTNSLTSWRIPHGCGVTCAIERRSLLGTASGYVQRFTFHFAFAGVGSTFPAASTACTSSLCLPGLTLNLAFAAQAVKSPLSSLHSKVEPDSLEVNENLALRLADLRL